VSALCEVVARHDLMIISDEIYRDLAYDTAPPFLSPAACAPERTVVTTAPSKSLALGGWRAGAARLPDSPAGQVLRDRVLRIAGEIWSAAPAPIQHAAALAFTEPRNWPNGSPEAGLCTRRSAMPWRASSPPPDWTSGHRRPPSTSIPASTPGAARSPHGLA
jgi:aspartate/methionine/tyrosine aminotransferase